jgi:uncharacterized protein
MPDTPADLPRSAAWIHRDSRDGFEVAFFEPLSEGHRVDGVTAAVSEGRAFTVRYELELDRSWATARARIRGRGPAGRRELDLEPDGSGGWSANGEPVAGVDGCLDVDLESSSLTNAFPMRRLAPGIGEEVAAPAVWVRMLDLSVERLEQRYRRDPDDGDRRRYRYVAPELGFAADLVYDEAGLILDYPGIATRAPG